MSDFSFRTPLYHQILDDWGLAQGTRAWMGDGNFKPVELIREGDYVFGITFRLEDEYIDRGGARPVDNLVKVVRPRLQLRKVLKVDAIEARAWQLTFGAFQKPFEARRLVAGADTIVGTFPLTHELHNGERLVDLQTAMENPRTKARQLQAMEYDPEWSEEWGSARYRPTAYTDQPQGELATIIPYEAFGGQFKLLRGDVRPYQRYLYSQCREVIPILEKTTLYRIAVQPDTQAEFGVYPGMPPRANLIVQTPFAPEQKKRKVWTDDLAREVMEYGRDIKDPKQRKDAWEKKWDEWASNLDGGKARVSARQRQEEHVSRLNGMFYDSQMDPQKAEALKRWYGITGGFLNGGILVNVTPEQTAALVGAV